MFPARPQDNLEHSMYLTSPQDPLGAPRGSYHPSKTHNYKVVVVVVEMVEVVWGGRGNDSGGGDCSGCSNGCGGGDGSASRGGIPPAFKIHFERVVYPRSPQDTLGVRSVPYNPSVIRAYRITMSSVYSTSP